MPNQDISKMQLSPGRHGKCLKHSNKNCFCTISFLSFALIFWNMAVLLLDQTEKCFFSTSFLLQPSACSLTRLSLVRCVPSVVFLAVLHIIACKTNQGDKCLFTCLPTELVSSKESQATDIFITTKNGEVQNHSSKTWHYLYINKLHIVLTLQVIFTRVEQTCCKVFPVDIQIATFGVASCKYLFFNLTPLTAGFSSFFLQLLQLLKQSERRFWHTSPNFDNHGVQNCLRNIVFILPSP